MKRPATRKKPTRRPRAAVAPAPTLRERQQEHTRELILDALIAQLGDTGPFEYSVFEVARRAGVSVRTVYRHFPDRDALFAALGTRVNQRVGLGDYPESIDGIVELAGPLFDHFDREEPLLLAQLTTSLGKQVRSAARVERLDRMRCAIDDSLPELDAATRKRALGIFSSLLSANVWWRLKGELGLSGRESGAAVVWALGVLLEALREDNRKQKGKAS